VGGAGQHGIFRRHPTFTLAAQPWRKAVFDTGGHQNAGIAESDQAATFGMLGKMGFD
jgi:hypothetical protein